ncbi:MAG TPA: hypothetical protein DHW71_11220 [Gammaproteobacteria bacterium]|nr:hypothetical protein [Gammaproteobacteria bacterium]HCK93553.1 hypothetical protein [Gammaproteobacteria bacterium]|tara:strand:- start:11925 stop:12968 length:1044 start_codon:yes stop_codon:yes gene_type:complete
MSGLQKNRYYHFREDYENLNEEFDPTQVGSLAEYGYTYIEGVLREFEQQNPNQGLIFYVTSWTVHRLPTYGDNVIAIIMQDEFSREPKYREKVGAVFHACGLKPVLWRNLKYGSFMEKFANILAYARVLARDGMSGRIRSLFLKLKGQKLAPLYDIPLGFYANEPVEYIPFSQREKIMSFAGSVQHRVAKVKVPSPKEQARNRMVSALTALAENHPELPVHYRKTSNYKSSIASTESYTQELMNSKFCLVPRGANLETFRFYEAIRCGCIPIMEVIPTTPFYKGAPIIQLNDWSELETKVLELLAKPEYLEALHQDVLAWWDAVCSEKKVAQQIENHIAGRPVNYLV